MSRALGAALAVLVLGLALLPPAAAPDVASDLPGELVLHPGVALLDLFLPDLFQPVRMSETRPEVRSTWADAVGLPGPEAGLLPLHVGMTALLLALVALIFVRGPWGWAARAALLAGLLLLLLGTVPAAWTAGRLLLLVALAALAGLQLRDLGPSPPGAAIQPADPQAGLALGIVAVIFVAVLAWAALQAGRQSDFVVARPAMERLIELLPENAPGLGPREVAAANALRLALDRAALAGFAAMTALLLHLRARRLATGLLVLGVAAAELLLPRWLA